MLFWTAPALPLAGQYDLPEPILFPTPDFNEIDEIEQDGNGLLWLTTDKGLFCFDGLQSAARQENAEAIDLGLYPGKRRQYGVMADFSEQ